MNGLEAKIKQHYGTADAGGEEGEDYGHGLMDLSTFILKNQCECLNESDEHGLANAFTTGPGYLESDVDEQLIISVTFNQAVKIHSIKMKAPPKNGPKHVKLWINQPVTIDFDKAESTIAVQDIEVSEKDLETGNPINLRYVKFQNVQNIQVFVKDNQSGDETTVIEYLTFIGEFSFVNYFQSCKCNRNVILIILGSPIITTKMDDFKRISGKAGESH